MSPRVTWAKRSRLRSNDRSVPDQRLIDGQASANPTIRTPPTTPATTVERLGPRRVMITSVPEVSWIFAIFPHSTRGPIYPLSRSNTAHPTLALVRQRDHSRGIVSLLAERDRRMASWPGRSKTTARPP